MMKIIIGILFIALATITKSVESSPPKKVADQVDEPNVPAKSTSPTRMPRQLWVPEGPASTSYNKYTSPPPSPPKRKHGKAPAESSKKPSVVKLDKALQALKDIGIQNTIPAPKYLFYLEDGNLRRITSRDGLVERHGYIVGKVDKDNNIMPVYNVFRETVIHHRHDHIQYLCSPQQAETLGFTGKVPPECERVYEIPVEDIEAAHEKLKKLQQEM